MRFALMLLLLLACASCAPGADAQIGKLLPVDEADHDPSFFLFRARLFEAIAERDTTFLYAHVDPGIRISFGPAGGLADFKKTWRLGEPDTELWSVLARVLGRGGTFSEHPESGDSLFRFTAPYIFSEFPDEVDAFTHEVVLGGNVRVRAEPNLESESIATLSYDVVEVRGPETGAEATPEGWKRVVLDNGTVGYVSDAYLASSIDYRAGFEKKAGQWTMTYFVAGD